MLAPDLDWREDARNWRVIGQSRAADGPRKRSSRSFGPAKSWASQATRRPALLFVAVRRGGNLSGFADTPTLLSRRQDVTSRAAVRIKRAPHTLWNHEFSETQKYGAHFAGRLVFKSFLNHGWVPTPDQHRRRQYRIAPIRGRRVHTPTQRPQHLGAWARTCSACPDANCGARAPTPVRV
jgi:hypothetical protein